MKILRHLDRTADTDLLRQTYIDRMCKFFGWDAALGIKHRKVAAGVNTGIGPAGADHFHGNFRKLRQRPVQFAFNCRHTALLGLKACEISAVIGSDKHYPFHKSPCQEIAPRGKGAIWEVTRKVIQPAKKRIRMT